MDYIKPYLLEIVLGLAALVLVLVLLVFVINARISRLSKLLRSLFTGPSGEDLEAMLRRCLAESGEAMQRQEGLQQRLLQLAERTEGCVQQVGLVRYNAYGDVAGEQSFSLVLLDGQSNGAIITGLFARSDSRCYGKAVVAGAAEQMLTEEEQTALEMATSGGVAKLPAPSGNGKARPRPAGRR